MNFAARGIILKRRDFGEADKILTILTPSRGKIDAIAKGVRKIKARLGGHLELFYEVDFDLREGKTWHIVAGAETVNRFQVGDLDKFNLASKAAKLVTRIGQDEQENPRLYDLFRDFLSEVDFGGELLLRQFEWQLLLANGLSPKIKNCTACNGILSKDNISIAPQAGGVVCGNCHKDNLLAHQITENTYKALRLFEHAPLGAARKIAPSSINPAELRKINKMFWEYYLDYSLE